MAYLLGADEAGYGPNLGPLVISATLWEVPDELLRRDLYPLLERVVSRRACSAGEAARIAIADSKQLYKPGGGLGALERGVLGTLPQMASERAEKAADDGLLPRCWRDVWSRFDSRSCDDFFSAPWYRGFDMPLPCGASIDELAAVREAFAAITKDRGVRLARVESRVVRVAEFNRLLERHGNKAEVLSRMTLELVARLLAPLPPAPTLVHCDKHGGRNRYAPLLQRAFPEHLVEVHGEGRAQSVYRWGPRDCRVEVRFVAEGEAALPAALASMTSKYLRELAMQAFNDFWRREVPGVKPTAGYPVDARRFRQQIAARQVELGIDDGVLWRRR